MRILLNDRAKPAMRGQQLALTQRAVAALDGDAVSLMQVSAAHVYLTYPFVLSWSMLQAMSAGAPVIASNTAPVLEVIEDGTNGLVVDFFASERLAQRVIDVLAHPGDYAAMRIAARRTIIENYDLESLCLPRWLQLLGLPGAE